MSTFKSLNPTNLSDVVVETKLATPDEIADAARRARAAQKAWAKMPAPARGRVIANAGRLFENNKEALSKLVTREMGKVYREALGDVQEVIDTCDFFLGEGRRLYGQTVPSEMPNKNLFTFRMPVGTALIITAGNFPAAVPSWYIIPALLTGNSVVWKPSEYTPAVAEAMTAIFHAAGVPKDVLITVVAEGKETFEGMVKGLDEGTINKVGFTGSTEVGRLIGAKVGEYIQSACLELGGKNPMIIMPDADLDLALDGALFAGFGTAGQRCTCARRLIIKNGAVGDAFIQRLVEVSRNLVVGQWDAQPQPFMGGVISLHAAQQILQAQQRLIDLGAQVLLPVTQADANSSLLSPGLLDVTHVSDVPDEEYFGPLSCIYRYDHFDEALALANGTRFGLSVGLVSPDRELFDRLLIEARAGIVNWNKPLTGASSAAPFGGVGASGNHRASAFYAADYCAWPMASLESQQVSLPEKLSPGIVL